MVADGTGSQGTGDNEVYNWRVRCVRCRDQLRELARIHLAVDAPTPRCNRMNRIGSVACGRYAFT